MNNIDKMYLDKFIESMTIDTAKWEMTTSYTIGGVICQYRSCGYGTITFSFGSGVQGAWINGHYEWGVPRSVLSNPFNEYFWIYRNAKNKVKKYTMSKRITDHNNELTKEFKKHIINE